MRTRFNLSHPNRVTLDLSDEELALLEGLVRSERSSSKANTLRRLIVDAARPHRCVCGDPDCREVL